ncbi:insulin-like growth factor-binding protein 6 [Polymixia lowei]
MPLCLNILALLYLQLALSSALPVTSLVTSSRRCLTCKGNQEHRTTSPRHQSAELSTDLLAVGEPCGVYTLSCARGIRCTPPEDDPRPLQALLEGRGVCSNVTSPAPSEDPEKAPCRRLLMTIMKGLDSQLFQTHYDIYMPNCDKRGFFRKKQCRSSRGMQRGNCWCVDEHGMLMPSYTKQQGTPICD